MNEESMNEMRQARDAAKKSVDRQKLAGKAAKALVAAEKEYEHDLREYELAVKRSAERLLLNYEKWTDWQLKAMLEQHGQDPTGLRAACMPWKLSR